MRWRYNIISADGVFIRFVVPEDFSLHTFIAPGGVLDEGSSECQHRLFLDKSTSLRLDTIDGMVKGSGAQVKLFFTCGDGCDKAVLRFCYVDGGSYLRRRR